jgi:hypothetical protein
LDKRTLPTPLNIISTINDKPLNRGQKQAEPLWMSNYRSAKGRDEKFAILEAVNSLHINQPFPQKMTLPDRDLTINLPSEVSIERPFTIWEYFLPQKNLIILSANTNLNARLERAKQHDKVSQNLIDNQTNDFGEDEIL